MKLHELEEETPPERKGKGGKDVVDRTTDPCRLLPGRSGPVLEFPRRPVNADPFDMIESNEMGSRGWNLILVTNDEGKAEYKKLFPDGSLGDIVD